MQLIDSVCCFFYFYEVHWFWTRFPFLVRSGFEIMLLVRTRVPTFEKQVPLFRHLLRTWDLYVFGHVLRSVLERFSRLFLRFFGEIFYFFFIINLFRFLYFRFLIFYVCVDLHLFFFASESYLLQRYSNSRLLCFRNELQ